MDLSSLASQLNQKNIAATKALMPQQQQSRSYQDNTEYSQLVITLTRYKVGVVKNNWTLQYKPSFPIGTTGRNATLPQMMAFAKDYLASNTDTPDLKYIDVTRADVDLIEYTFLHDKWFQDNMSHKPNFRGPTSLYWHYTKLFPRIVFVNNVGSDLQHFIEDRFEVWVDKKPTYLKHEKFAFIEKIAAILFNFKWDYASQRMYAHLKYSVILGSLALYMTLFHHKDAKTVDIRKIQQQAANFGDVKKLDKYIRKLK